jgi:SRSO17 transposase
MTGGVTLEQVEGWGEDLKAFISMTGRLFTRPEPRVNFADFIGCLLSDVSRKNGWQIAAHAGHLTPDRQQKLLSGAKWDADELRDIVRNVVVEHLGADGAGDDAVLVFDETAAIKQGTKSVGVARQYAGITGQVENCQTMVMMSYATTRGHSFIDRMLYLPESWTDDMERRAEAGVPEDLRFETKPALATAMLARSLAAGVRGAVAADEVYGRDPRFRQYCHDEALTYVVHVPTNLPVTVGRNRTDAKGAARMLAQAGDAPWQRYSCGEGSKGLRYYDWWWLGGIDIGQVPADGFEHTLLVRRSVANPGDVHYLLAHAPARTPLPELVGIGGLRWAVEEDNAIGKDEIGLDQYEVRKWTPWHRHVTSCMFAAAFLAITRASELGKGSAGPDSD